MNNPNQPTSDAVLDALATTSKRMYFEIAFGDEEARVSSCIRNGETSLCAYNDQGEKRYFETTRSGLIAALRFAGLQIGGGEKP